MKYCKDCKHVGHDILLPWHLQDCKHPTELDMTGSKSNFPFASISRKWGPCGPEAKYFEPRIPFWKRILSWLVK